MKDEKFLLVMKLNDLIENKKLELLVELVHKHSFSHTKMYLSQTINKLIYINIKQLIL